MLTLRGYLVHEIIGDAARLVEIAAAMKRDIAARRDRRLGAGAEGAAQRLHREVVGEEEPVEADLSPDDLLHHPA